MASPPKIPPADPRAGSKTRVAMGAVVPPPPSAAPRAKTPPAAVRAAAKKQPVAAPAQPKAAPADRGARDTDVGAARAGTVPLAVEPSPTSPLGSTTDGDFQRGRATRVGTQIAGTQGLELPSADAPKLRLSPGATVPGTRYKIVKWLGEGGMGVVYEAEHIDIERRVAFKILRFDLSKQPRMVQVFRDEARAASRLGSQHIVEIYDFGELPDGRLFFCMELLEGKDLVPESENQTMEASVLLSTMRQVAKGLHGAHRSGVVHRDVKPENIITVSRDGRAGVVKIVDFGISAMLAAGDSGGGGIAGTPHYMAPEQITGQAFDGRLDVYALGVTAYELLVGRPPFDADELEPLLQMHLVDPPLPPSQVRPDLQIPAPLEGVIMKCLEKSPDDRYADMADLEAALCEAQIEAGIHTAWDDLALPDIDDIPRKERLLRDMPSPLAEFGAGKRKWLWPAVAGVSMLATAGLAAFVITRGPTDEQKTEVDGIITEARDAAAKADWVFPPPDDREAPTAYLKILQLEGVEGPAAGLADEQAQGLRGEFSGTLIEHGNQLWEIPGARPLARDYYAWGVLFDSDNPQAFERSGMSSGALADMADRLKNGQYTAAELALSRAALAAVETDEAKKAELEAQAFADESVLGLGSSQALAEAMKATGSKMRRKKAAPDPAPEDPDTEEEMVLDETAGEEGSEVGTGGEEELSEGKKRRLRRRDVEAVLGKAKRDPKKANDLAEQGMAALRAGRRKEAESLFNQAVAYDRKNAKALMGLSDVYFDLGSNQKALLYAERAVKAAASNRTYRLKLGDAYFKVLRYRDALEQYEKAKKLGEKRADARIAKVKSKLGG